MLNLRQSRARLFMLASGWLVLASWLVVLADEPAKAPASYPVRGASQPAGPQSLPFTVYDGYFVSNRFESNEPASFVIIFSQKEFDKIFGVATVMGDKSNRLEANAFDSKTVLAVIKRGKVMWRYKVKEVVVENYVLTLRYTAMAAAPHKSAEFACPLIVAIASDGLRPVIQFEENGKVVKEIASPSSSPATKPAP